MALIVLWSHSPCWTVGRRRQRPSHTWKTNGGVRDQVLDAHRSSLNHGFRSSTRYCWAVYSKDIVPTSTLRPNKICRMMMDGVFEPSIFVPWNIWYQFSTESSQNMSRWSMRRLSRPFFRTWRTPNYEHLQTFRNCWRQEQWQKVYRSMATEVLKFSSGHFVLYLSEIWFPIPVSLWIIYEFHLRKAKVSKSKRFLLPFRSTVRKRSQRLVLRHFGLAPWKKSKDVGSIREGLKLA